MAEMNRREAFKALTVLAGATGLTVAPVTTQDAAGVELVLLKVQGKISQDATERLRAVWTEAVKGTALEQTRTLVLAGDVEAEFVRTKCL